ncbi:MAG: PIN domain nuclease [Chloroflexota bacterium]|nr:PIN domain nuclease [Chloroflexota bacterium]
MMRFVRLTGGALGAIVAISVASGAPGFFDPSLAGRLLLVAWIAAWTVVGYSIMPYITVQPATRLVRGVMDLSTSEFVAAVGGLLLGLLMGVLLGGPLAHLPDPFGLMLPIGVSVVLGLGMMGLTVAKRGDLFEGLRGLGLLDRREVPVAAVERSDGPLVYVDTSAIIDGRITDVAAAGFLIGTLVVPRFVLDELQRIADHGDAARRTRGRRGLDILSQLQKDPRVDFELSDEDAPAIAEVDGKLVALARARNGAVLTTDYNLNRVAQLQGVRVLNLNHLSNALKPAFLPGEEMRVKVIQQGKEVGQGVAFLDDGTMIVVEGGGSHLQSELDVTVTRVLQTVAGRMVFAHPRP